MRMLHQIDACHGGLRFIQREVQEGLLPVLAVLEEEVRGTPLLVCQSLNLCVVQHVCRWYTLHQTRFTHTHTQMVSSTACPSSGCNLSVAQRVSGTTCLSVGYNMFVARVWCNMSIVGTPVSGTTCVSLNPCLVQHVCRWYTRVWYNLSVAKPMSGTTCLSLNLCLSQHVCRCIVDAATPLPAIFVQ